MLLLIFSGLISVVLANCLSANLCILSFQFFLGRAWGCIDVLYYSSESFHSFLFANSHDRPV